YIRDAKIDTLYEGTTAIQGMDLFFRKIIRDQGQALGFLNNEIQAFLDNEAGNGRLKDERALLATALGDIQQMIGAMIGQARNSQQDPTSLYKVGQNTSRLLLCMGDLVTGWLLLRQAEVAMSALGREDVSLKDQDFYEGKLAVARFFATQVLPTITAQRAICEATDNTIMELGEAAF
ncbi:MAG: acyl-CoA dehydrogenase, partial [Geodermatophilaceae bacterium]|nr:acyl-CoA dehydrogenase [Geodermatophilaceae bacterium]